MTFYSYLWLREDGTPYYAGKGANDRAFRSSGHTLHAPPKRARILVFPMLNETEAFESEIALIELFGRKDLGTGCLRNRTAGGEGAAGYVPSLESRNKMRIGQLGRKHSPVSKANRSKALKGRIFTSEWKMKLSEAKKGNQYRLGTGRPKIKLTPEEKRRHRSEAQIGKKQPPRAKEWCRHLSKSLMGHKVSEIARRKMRDAWARRREKKS